jgi:hypothetical protein
MSNPSLLNIPYRFKASKLYSQIPDSGLGDFVVSRSASNAATRVNASGFIETVADNVPRLDYPLGGIANGCPALLVEPSAQNFVIQSEAFNTAGVWTLTNATAPNTTATFDPFGNTNADIFTANAAFGRTQSNNIITGATGNYTMSCFIKGISGVAAVGSLVVGRGVGFTITSGGVITVNAPSGYTQADSIGIQNYGNGWYRVFATRNYPNETHGLLIASSVSGNSFYIFGAQVEAGSVATSYIPTTTAPITRGADLVSKTGVSSLIGQTEGTIYLEVEQDPLNRDIFSLNTGTGNSIIFYKNSSNIVNARLYANSSTIFTIANAVATNGFVKIALAYKAGDSAMVINAGTAQTSASSFIFSSALSLVSLTPSWFTNAGFTKIRAIGLYPTRLTNAQLQALTT